MLHPSELEACLGCDRASRKREFECAEAEDYLRSSAGHLAEEAGALGSGLGHHGLGRVGGRGRRSSHGGGRAVRLGRGGRDGRARGSAADGALTRHGDCVWRGLVCGLW